MDLAFNLLLTLLLEIPLVGFFFRRKKRKNAYLIALLINIITWPIVNVIRLNTDFNLNIVEIGVIIVEAVTYWVVLATGWKKGFLIALLANLLSFTVTKFVYIGPDFLQKKSDIIVP
jgi:hypothetical protein